MPERMTIAEYAAALEADEQELARLWQTIRVAAPRLPLERRLAWNRLNLEHLGRQLRLLDYLEEIGARRQDGGPIAAISLPARFRCFSGLVGCSGSLVEARAAVPRLEVGTGIESSTVIETSWVIVVIIIAAVALIVTGATTAWIVTNRQEIRGRLQAMREGLDPEAIGGSRFISFLKILPWVGAGLLGLWIGGKWLLQRSQPTVRELP